MYRCLICRFTVPLDDAVAPTRFDTCICLSCYTRETNTTLRLSDRLRRQLVAITMEG